jgi:hypothetical protein
MYVFTSCYLSLLQYRGAIWFRRLIQIPDENEVNTSPFSKLWLPSVSQMLDMIQGPLNPLIALALWLSLLFGQISRAWYYRLVMCAALCCTLRAFVAIVSNRVASLNRISVLQSNAPGSVEDKQRRLGTLKQKTRGVLSDLISVGSTAGTSIWYFAIQSYLDSRRLVVSHSVGLSLVVVLMFLANMQLHIKLQRSSKTRRQERRKRATAEPTLPSQASGLSVVNQSCHNGTSAEGRSPAGGLFTEVETDA